MPTYGRLPGNLTSEDFAKLATVPAGFGIGVRVLSQTIDLVAGADVIIVPAMAGFYFIPNFNRLVIVDAAGTYSTTATVKVGNNATFDNVWMSTVNAPSLGDFTTALANLPDPTRALQLGAPTGPRIIDLAAPITMKITQAAAGAGLTLKVKLLMWGSFHAVGDFSP